MVSQMIARSIEGRTVGPNLTAADDLGQRHGVRHGRDFGLHATARMGVSRNSPSDPLWRLVQEQRHRCRAWTPRRKSRRWGHVESLSGAPIATLCKNCQGSVWGA